MCYHNHTQHNGCGHIGETYKSMFTLCENAEIRLLYLRGPTSPTHILQHSSTTPVTDPNFATPSKTKRRFGLFRSATTASSSSAFSAMRNTRRSISGPPNRASSYASPPPTGMRAPTHWGQIPDHEFEAVKCKNDADWQVHTSVSSEMEVCKECKTWIREMRHMIQRYDKTGNVKGTKAFDEFLKHRSSDDDEHSNTVDSRDGEQGSYTTDTDSWSR